MTATEAKTSRELDMDTVSRLLKEYSEKLHEMESRLQDMTLKNLDTGTGKDRRVPLIAIVAHTLDAYDAISASIENLVRTASQMLEHYSPEPLTELELKLRLRETEQALDSVQNAREWIQKYQPSLYPLKHD